MEILVKHGDSLKQKTPCLVMGVWEGRLRTPPLRELDTRLDGALSRAFRDGEFSGRQRETLLLYPGAALPAERLLLVGLGKDGRRADREGLRQALGAATGLLLGRRISRFSIDAASFSVRRLEGALLGQTLAEGVELGAYRFDHFRTEKSAELPPPLDEVRFVATTPAAGRELSAGMTVGRAICRGVCLARDLVNQPGNIKSPDYLARRAREIAEEVGLHCEILERPELEALGMGALLGVAQGSIREARLIVLQYRGGLDEARPVALVGKGVVFDAGGISLKPAEKMDEMKMDMAGGAAVLGTLLAAALLKLPVNLVGVIPAVENLPSGSAIRPGDILTSLSGRTIEIMNTDAEGRLILADALTYVRRFEPRVVIDLATLTGACIIALGHHASAVLGNHDGLVRQLLKAGETSGERLWQLPLWSDYGAQIKSEVADVKNTGGRPAGTITAAAFLEKFAEGLTWAHLDIAGTAWEEKGRPGTPKGGTGVGVRLLIEYLR
ncbi:leucyl aminopeptidase [Desulfuromonas carbonis]|uniref:leucyl aminopeptidase n=1 Tax=Desulfuromonas sp. DDH964 TaxID=1823759 RepID=UPI00078C5266|nr:leucyl aminopeptidase [Desulfuromonas sp. DDH964]AMV71065.1 multifunctional aminopeptidase A [Desulfuromonas sp. DDH964]